MEDKRKLMKMNKSDLQKMIIKKKQCDARALLIVEQLLEANVDPNWFLQNLKFLNKSHMEDIIEERTIIKLCGYVLCSKPLIVVRQQYHISTRTNKVYDISKRKKFCSLLCYKAYNYLFEQMLDSPLWFRDNEANIVFKILPTNSKPVQCTSTNKIIDNNCIQNITNNINDKKKYSGYNTMEQTKDVSCDISDLKEKNTHNLLNNVNIEKDIQVQEISLNTDSQKIFNCETNLSKPYKNSRNKDYSTQESKDHNDNTEKINIKSENLEVESIRQHKNILHSYEHNIEQTLQFQLNDADNKNDEIRTLQIQSDEIYNSCNAIMPSNSHVKCRKEENVNKIDKTKLIKQKEFNNVETPGDNLVINLVRRIEQNVRKWITKDTVCLLLGKENEKDRLLEKFLQQEKHENLCKKLNKMQLEDKLRNCANQEKDILKPLPDLSVLQKDGKKLELKIRAFYKGQMTFSSSEDSNKEAENKNDDNELPLILPLIEKYTPNIVRHKIFLDKLNTILPNLLHSIIKNGVVSSIMQRSYNNVRYCLIKFLISTFSLSAENIVFLSGEWKLVGLIIIKMLSLIDAELQSLFQSKQASIYISMILGLYKLDSNYLDTFIISITNDNTVQGE